MLDADKISHLTPDVVWQLSETEWRDCAWRTSVIGILSGKTLILKITNGKWFVACSETTDVALLQMPWEIIKRIRQLAQIRPLPEIISVCAIPPMRFGTPMSMLSCIPYRDMPEPLWIELAWRLSVDHETAQSTKLLSTSGGVYQVRCNSAHAWDALKHPELTLCMLAWFSSLRKLPDAHKIVCLLGDI
ncbi:MAG: hypothetical protein IKY83_13615 [Proteobacteria bacterium]|nr:hypothetical protein [Pseudomonadota bacterium]